MIAESPLKTAINKGLIYYKHQKHSNEKHILQKKITRKQKFGVAIYTKNSKPFSDIRLVFI